MKSTISGSEVAIVDENPLDSIRHMHILKEMKEFQKVISYSKLAYLEADLMQRVHYKDIFPSLIIVDIHFKNTIEFVSFYLKMNKLFKRYNIKLILMSCSDDKKFFKPLVSSGIDLGILVKPLRAPEISSFFRNT